MRARHNRTHHSGAVAMPAALTPIVEVRCRDAVRPVSLITDPSVCFAANMMVADIQELQGLWRRSLLTRVGRGSDTTTSVHWLQGLRAYIDLRRPTPRRDFSHVRAHADLSLEDCMWLARQEGFAGQLEFDGTHFEWTRTIDFQPRSSSADAGTLSWEHEILIETGRAADYIEHWHRDASTPTLPIVAVSLGDPERTTRATFVRVGTNFMFARARTHDLGMQHSSLAGYVTAALTLEVAQELVNCEISYGTVRGAEFQIGASSLPYRVGAVLRSRDLLGQWEITASEGELEAFHAA
jgi:hypothetical protein